MVFAIPQRELDMCPPHPECPSTSLLTLSLWVVPEHWLWMPCFMHQTCTDHSILHIVIYMFQCYSLKSSHLCLLPESKSLFFTSVSPFVALHVGSLVPSF